MGEWILEFDPLNGMLQPSNRPMFPLKSQCFNAVLAQIDQRAHWNFNVPMQYWLKSTNVPIEISMFQCSIGSNRPTCPLKFQCSNAVLAQIDQRAHWNFNVPMQYWLQSTNVPIEISMFQCSIDWNRPACPLKFQFCNVVLAQCAHWNFNVPMQYWLKSTNVPIKISMFQCSIGSNRPTCPLKFQFCNVVLAKIDQRAHWNFQCSIGWNRPKPIEISMFQCSIGWNRPTCPLKFQCSNAVLAPIDQRAHWNFNVPM